jgi:hypothetical protein
MCDCFESSSASLIHIVDEGIDVSMEKLTRRC